MYRVFMCALILSCLAAELYADESSYSSHIGLSQAEVEFLTRHKRFKYCVDPAWMPYERISDQGQHEGLTADYIRLLANILKVEFQLYPTANWQASIKAVRARDCDFLPLATENPQRRLFLDFIEPYISYPSVVATTNDKLFIERMEDVLEHSFAVTRGYSVIRDLKLLYPGIKLVEVDNIYQGLQMVRKHQVYGFIDSTLSIGHAIQQQGLLDIKISGKTGLSIEPTFAVRNDYPLMKDIIQKALNSITQEQRLQIYNKWIAVTYESPPNYKLVVGITLIALVILTVISFWNRRLAAANETARRALSELNILRKQLEQQNKQLADKNQQLNTFAHTDALTGLSNRARLDEVLDAEIQRCHRYVSNVGLVMLDLDHFKQVNDNFGHQVGDQVLKELSELLLEHTRQVDTVGRWGGEEFMLICPETDMPALALLAEKLRQIVAQHTFSVVDQQTASFGITVFEPGDSSSALVKKADNALYLAKSAGRNRVEKV